MSCTSPIHAWPIHDVPADASFPSSQNSASYTYVTLPLSAIFSMSHMPHPKTISKTNCVHI
jgi:hypothetical protein